MTMTTKRGPGRPRGVRNSVRPAIRISPVLAEMVAQSAAKADGGAGVIRVDGRSVYVAD